ncbi:MAG: hypothetical protein Q7S57_06285 [bacterium]|nr:hypothetical protein [bacterium]
MLPNHQIHQSMTALFTRFLNELGKHDDFFVEADTTGRVVFCYSGPNYSDLPVKTGLVIDDNRVICLTFSEEDSKEWIQEEMSAIINEVRTALEPKNATVATTAT